MAIGVGWILDPIISFLELVGAAIILGGGTWSLATLVRRHDAEQARHEFSRALLLGLDFTIGADMLKLAVAPDLSAAALAAGVTGQDRAYSHSPPRGSSSKHTSYDDIENS